MTKKSLGVPKRELMASMNAKMRLVCWIGVFHEMRCHFTCTHSYFLDKCVVSAYVAINTVTLWITALWWKAATNAFSLIAEWEIKWASYIHLNYTYCILNECSLAQGNFKLIENGEYGDNLSICKFSSIYWFTSFTKFTNRLMLLQNID